jgi:hypothetical protein
MVRLKEKNVIALSATRKCYLHPDDPGKVIKILREKPSLGKRDANWKEWRHYQFLKKRHAHLDFISTYHGFVETNLGRGLMSDCIRDYDGRVSVRLEKVLSGQVVYDIKAVHDALSRLCRKIIANNIQLFDLNQFNILIQLLADGSCKPVSIDIKGRYNNYELIPVSTYIPYFSRRKLRRRCHRLMQMVRRACQ